MNIVNVHSVATKVLEFYEQLPFNYASSPEIVVSEIKNNNVLSYYFSKWESLFKKGSTVLEMGCGAGWMSNAIKYYHGSDIVGIDFNPKAIGFAIEVAKLLTPQEQAKFVVSDLFEYTGGPYEVVVSMGVLHHTVDCAGGIKKACELTQKSGHIIIGLYHKYGRRPFLDHFKNLINKGYSEDELLLEYKKLDSRHKDDIMARSWFKDQVLHPHETQHTLAEVDKIFRENSVQTNSTSINGFGTFENVSDLYAVEKSLFDKGNDFLQNQKYYPGFFIVVGKKE